MTAQDKQKLFEYLDQDLGVYALDSELDEIERIATAEDRRLLSLAQRELRSTYQRVGITSSNILGLIDARLEQFPPTP